jgi:hypothetical protein
MSLVTLRVDALWTDGPPVGTLIRVERTEVVERMIERGQVSVLGEEEELPLGVEPLTGQVGIPDTDPDVPAPDQPTADQTPADQTPATGGVIRPSQRQRSRTGGTTPEPSAQPQGGGQGGPQGEPESQG